MVDLGKVFRWRKAENVLSAVAEVTGIVIAIDSSQLTSQSKVLLLHTFNMISPSVLKLVTFLIRVYFDYFH